MPKHRAPGDRPPGIFDEVRREIAAKPTDPQAFAAALDGPRDEPALPPAPAPSAPAATIAASGEMSIANGAVVRESISAAGRLTIGANALIENTVTAKAGADVREGARIEGQLTVTGTLRWGRGAVATSATIDGPFMTGTDHVRATSLTAPGGIHSGSSTTTAVMR